LRITRLKAWLVNLRLAEPYTVAYEQIDHAPNIFLRIETDKGVVGLGCVNPDEPVCGETPESVLGALDGPAREALTGADPRFVTRLRERVKHLLPALPHPRQARRTARLPATRWLSRPHCHQRHHRHPG
jgi:L-alanine-DL-glutamate epimerase-like enolase superfamily enzyme